MGIGLLEIVVIAVVALVLLGPQRLPSVLQQLGRFYVMLRRTSNDFRGIVDDVVRKAENEVRLDEIKRLTRLAEDGERRALAAVTSLTDHPDTPPVSEEPKTEPPPHGRSSDAHANWDDSLTPSPTANPLPPEKTHHLGDPPS